MVGLNPAKFYGRLLPRPRIYCDVKFSDSRVDPPESVNAALLEWASEASWRMGGTATNRKRMSGKVEGRMKRLRDMDESDEEEEAAPPPKKKKQPLSFRKESSSPAAKPKTPIERMLEPPSSGVPKKSRRRILSGDDDDTETQVPAAKPKARRRRKDQAVPETDEDSDEDNMDSFLQEENHTPRRSARKSNRVQASPTPSSRRKSPVKKSPLKRVVESSDSDCDSDSVFL